MLFVGVPRLVGRRMATMLVVAWRLHSSIFNLINVAPNAFVPAFSY